MPSRYLAMRKRRRSWLLLPGPMASLGGTLAAQNWLATALPMWWKSCGDKGRPAWLGDGVGWGGTGSVGLGEPAGSLPAHPKTVMLRLSGCRQEEEEGGVHKEWRARVGGWAGGEGLSLGWGSTRPPLRCAAA